MNVGDALRACGLELVGDPPSTQVRVGGRTVPVRVETDDARVTLRASVPAGGDGPSGELRGASLLASGDTSYERTSGSLVGTRTLVDPDPGALYDALFDLAKGTVGVSQLLEQLTALSDDVTTPAEQPTPVGATPAGDATQAPSKSAAPVTSPAAPTAPAPPAAAFWFYVHAPQPAVSAQDPNVVIATLQPGQWYRGDREERGWVHVVLETGAEGWTTAATIRRRQ